MGEVGRELVAELQTRHRRIFLWIALCHLREVSILEMHKSTRGKLADAGKRFVFGLEMKVEDLRNSRSTKLMQGCRNGSWRRETGERPESVGQNPLNLRTLEINSIT